MCYTPVQLKKEGNFSSLRDTYRMQQVPCGKCLECKKQRVNSWYVRLLEEKKISRSARFVTLTYDDDTIPLSDSYIPTLDYGDFQRFMKRLRKADQKEVRIKYFLVGEYGEKTQRPHYHVIMFNVNDIENVRKEWHYGHIHVGDVTDASIYYTLKYALKNIGEDKPNLDRKPEKALISKGMGLSYLTPQMVNYYKKDVSRGVTLIGNQKVGLPRYYRDKMFTEEEKIKRVKSMENLIAEKYEKTLHPLYTQRVKHSLNQQKTKIKKTD
ncbi:rolling circle replication-associated protein [Jeotgalibaca porci]|uniref:rolling circle replication-associated protein n=1 Tax=Jeotgalibaca porci TaxID=1868793 RepID=UPI0040390B1C